jgi:type VI secretion system protein ImpE
MSIQEHFQAGRLSEAIAEATEQVKKAPADIDRRALLCELLCFLGDLDRADHHLDAISRQDTTVVPGVSLLRQLIRADHHRRQFFAEGRVPELVNQPSEDIRLRLQASIDLREERRAEAAELLAQANENAGCACTANGQPCENFRDLDDLTATIFEVFSPTGKYFWIPMAEVESIEFRAPNRPLDLLWRPALMSVRNGPEGEVYLPTLYPGSHTVDEVRTRLGRTTDWDERDGIVRGIGQRMFLLGEEAATLLDLQTFETVGATEESQV